MTQQITDYRKEHHMSKAQFAKECGVSIEFLRQLGKGNANPTLEMLKKLANCMGKDVTDMLFPY